MITLSSKFLLNNIDDLKIKRCGLNEFPIYIKLTESYDITQENINKIKKEIKSELPQKYKENFKFFGTDIDEFNKMTFIIIHIDVNFKKEKMSLLEKLLRKLEIINFEIGKYNYYLKYDYMGQKIEIDFTNFYKRPNCIYFSKKSIKNFDKNIRGQNITEKEFFDTYNKVFGGR